MEREITLKDMILVVLKKAKALIAWMLVFGVLLAAFGFYKGLGNSVKATPEQIAQLEQEVAIAEKSVIRVEEQINKLEDYLENSLYYSIDPYSKGISTLTFCVNGSEEQLEQIAAMYASKMWYDDELLAGICEIFGEELDERYILEVVSVSGQSGGTIKISVIHRDAQTASQTVTFVYDFLVSKASAVIPHTTKILTSYSGYEVDTAMRDAQNKTGAALSDARSALGEQKKTLAAAKNALSDALGTGGMGDALKKGILFGVIGLVVGAVLGVIAICLLAIMSGRLCNTAEAVHLFRAYPLLGILPKDGKKRLFDKTIRSLEGEPKVGFDEAVRYLSANLRLVVGDEKVLFTGTAGSELIQKAAEGLEAFSCGYGNILTDPAAVETLEKTEKVVLVEERGVSRFDLIDSELTRLKTLGKEIVGIILY